MDIHHLSTKNSILNFFLAEIRNKETQKNSMRFRKNMEHIGEILGYEMSKHLSYEEQILETPLAKTTINLPSKPTCP